MGFKIYPQPFENGLYDLFFVHDVRLTAGPAKLGSPAINAGINYSTKFTTDEFGTARPSSGPWSSGAYQLAGTTPSPTPSPTPVATPVAAPSSFTIGQTALQTSIDGGNGNLMLAQSATLAKVGIIQSMSFYVNQAAGTLRLALYDASGPAGGPGTKKAETTSITPVTHQSANVPILASSFSMIVASLLAGTDLKLV